MTPARGKQMLACRLLLALPAKAFLQRGDELIQWSHLFISRPIKLSELLAMIKFESHRPAVRLVTDTGVLLCEQLFSFVFTTPSMDWSEMQGKLALATRLPDSRRPIMLWHFDKELAMKVLSLHLGDFCLGKDT